MNSHVIHFANLKRSLRTAVCAVLLTVSATLLLPMAGCASPSSATQTSLTRAEVYRNALTALAVMEQGLQTWELLATISGRLTDAEIASQRATWERHIAAMRSIVEALEPPANGTL